MNDMAAVRLHNQKISGASKETPDTVVSWAVRCPGAGVRGRVLDCGRAYDVVKRYERYGFRLDNLFGEL